MLTSPVAFNQYVASYGVCTKGACSGNSPLKSSQNIADISGDASGIMNSSWSLGKPHVNNNLYKTTLKTIQAEVVVLQ